MTGKLNFYVNAVDDLLKQGDDNSRIKDMLPTQEQLKEWTTCCSASCVRPSACWKKARSKAPEALFPHRARGLSPCPPCNGDIREM